MRKHWRKLLLVYLALVAASNVVRLLPADTAPTKTGEEAGELSFTRLADDTGRPVTLAYRDVGPREGTPVVLVHGSPTPGGFDQFVPTLRQDYRLIVPHLPGFGASTRRVSDYSIRAHAHYLLALLDTLHIDSAHIAGYSMGSGVGLEVYRLAPERVRSLSLVSGIGVQELEMFGNYHLNHAVHGVQLALLRAVEWGTPHFGMLDNVMLNARYARNFFDTDQRPLRAIIERFEPPALIVHGRRDTLVPFAAAREHHRIMPHSVLVEVDGGHGLVFFRAGELAGHVAHFIESVERGAATRRAQAPPERHALAAEPFAMHHDPALVGLAWLLMLLTLALATFVSEDAACIAGGLIVAAGIAGYVPITIACLIGIYSGDALLFVLGRHLGAPALQRAPFKWMLSGSGLSAARAWFDRRGAVAILISRFVPGTRFATYVAAGALGTSFLHFSGYFLLAAVLWTPLLVGVSAWLGDAVWAWFGRFSQLALPALALSALLVFVAVRLLLPLTTFRGRRLALGRWQRLTRWTYWPRWLVYAPLVAYVLYLGLRYRKLTLFTAANPAIPRSGFAGESRIAILEALAASGAPVAHAERLPTGTPRQRADAVANFMARHALAFPVVLKPDVGARGQELCIAHDRTQVADYLHTRDGDVLVQAFAHGAGFSVFYVRHPGDERGRLFSITQKRPPTVTGDGMRTLQTLILADRDAVSMAPAFLDRHAARLFDVPAQGEEISLVEVGSRAQGCRYFDGQWLHSEPLARAIDDISHGYDGFYFGRYDLRTPDSADLRRGENFKIVELSGVAALATHIYDPSCSLWRAYRTLAEQWRIAFAIGDYNHRQGAPITPSLALLRRALA